MRFPLPRAVAACLALAFLPHGATGQTIQERIDQGLSAAGEPTTGTAEGLSVTVTHRCPMQCILRVMIRKILRCTQNYVVSRKLIARKKPYCGIVEYF